MFWAFLDQYKDFKSDFFKFGLATLFLPYLYFSMKTTGIWTKRRNTILKHFNREKENLKI
jgi:hypothetical protein